MQRGIIVGAVLVFLLLAGVLGFILLRGQPQPPTISVNAADENASEPYHREMDCIDRLLRQHNLSANEVEPALARCHGGGGQDQNLAQ